METFKNKGGKSKSPTDLSSVMFDAKFHGRHSGAEVELVESVIVVALLQERAVGRLGKIGFVVQQMQNANRFLCNQTNYRLVILLFLSFTSR